MKSWKLINFCEIDKFATKAYCVIHNVDKSLNLGDVSAVDTSEIEDFTMLCGGSPCQDFSVAGKQAGAIWTCQDCGHKYNPLEAHYTERDCCPNCGSKNIEKTRSSLLVEYLRVLRDKKPKFAIYENVKNIVGKTFKPTFDLFINELYEYGYNTYYKILNAKNFGVPQNRERLYLIIIRKDIDNGKFEFPQGFDNGIRLKDVLEEKVEDKYYLSDKMVEGFIKHNENHEVKGTGFIWKPRDIDGVASTLRANASFCPTDNTIQHIENYKTGIDKSINNTRKIEYANCITAREDRGVSNRKAEGTAIVEYPNECIQSGDLNHYGNDQMNRTYSPNGISPTVMTKTGGGREVKITEPFTVASRGRYKNGIDGETEQQFEPNLTGNTNTITTVQKDNYVCEPSIVQKPHGFNKGGEFKESTTLTSHSWECNNFLKERKCDEMPNFRIRKLTPKECYRLMSFTDEAFDKAASVISNSQLYKTAGNSIVVDVLYYIYLELYKVMPELFDDLTLVSLFSGIGAFECALNKLYDTINGDTENFIQPQTD